MTRWAASESPYVSQAAKNEPHQGQEIVHSAGVAAASRSTGANASTLPAALNGTKLVHVVAWQRVHASMHATKQRAAIGQTVPRMPLGSAVLGVDRRCGHRALAPARAAVHLVNVASCKGGEARQVVGHRKAAVGQWRAMKCRDSSEIGLQLSRRKQTCAVPTTCFRAPTPT